LSVTVGLIMVNVIFDYGIANEWVATFADEKTYMLCLPHLEMYAKQIGAEVVESVDADKE